MKLKRIAKALGWFSVALGAAEVAAPRKLTRALGLGAHDKLLRTFGTREIGPGVALLTKENKAPFLWARVAGDALDLLALGAAFKRSSKRLVVGAVVAAVAGIGVVDFLTARSAQRLHIA